MVPSITFQTFFVLAFKIGENYYLLSLIHAQTFYFKNYGILCIKNMLSCSSH